MLDLTLYEERFAAHVAADELVRGVGFEGGKGCFIGCLFHHYDHARGAEESGIPEWVLRLCDSLHEGMSNAVDRGETGKRLIESFKWCGDFDAVEHGIHLFIQRKNLDLVKRIEIDAEIKNQALAAIDRVIRCYEADLPKNHKDWSAAARSAWAAARSACSAGEAARSAGEAARAAGEAARAAVYDEICAELLRLLEMHDERKAK